MAEKLSAILQIKKLREEEAKLVEAAKAEALAKTREGIEELNILGFNYELVGPGQVIRTTQDGNAQGDRSLTQRNVSDLPVRNQPPARQTLSQGSNQKEAVYGCGA